MIYIASRRRSPSSLRKAFGDAEIFDVTSRSPSDEMRRLSPFFPHGNIPVPGAPHLKAVCVESVWQALKVFSRADVDIALLSNTSGRGLKRTERQFGAVLGHRWIETGELLSYAEARRRIYIPTYRWMLENEPSARPALERIRDAGANGTVVLLDYNINENPDDLSSPLSHAGLVKRFICEEAGLPEQRHFHPESRNTQLSLF